MPPVNRTPRVVRAAGDSHRRKTSYHWVSFRRTGEQIACRGDLSSDFVACAALDPSVVTFSRHVPSLQWFDGDKWRTHRPLFGVVRRPFCSMDQTVSYVDVEWSWTVVRDAEMYRRLSHEAAGRHLSYEVLDERSIRAQPRLTNARIVQSQAGPGIVPHVDADALDEFVRQRAIFTIRQVVDGTMLDHDRAYTAVLNRVATGDFEIDLGIRFDASQPIKNRSARCLTV